MANELAVQEKKVRYVIEGREIVLTENLVRKYLVRGKGELTTVQEIALFMGICRARQMDPWAGDCYIIKYAQNDPAQIVTSIDFVRARARNQNDCEGWICGVIVAGADGKPRDSAGLVLDGEKLLGGWCECQPKGWRVPQRLEVNLSGYLKKTSEGKITKFWSPENQPTMISKVAEMQNLRRIWPAALGKLYLSEEAGTVDISDGLNIDMEPGGEGKNGAWQEKPEESIEERFIKLTEGNAITGEDLVNLKKFITASAAATKKSNEEMMSAAVQDFPAFLKIYRKNLQKKLEREEMEAKAAKAEKKVKTKTTEPEGLSPEAGEALPVSVNENKQMSESDSRFSKNRDDETFVVCSAKNGDEMTRGFCRSACTHYKSPNECEDFLSESI